ARTWARGWGLSGRRDVDVEPEGAGAGPEPAYAAAVPKPTRSTTAGSAAQDVVVHVRRVVLLTSATLPFAAARFVPPVARGVTGSGSPTEALFVPARTT